MKLLFTTLMLPLGLILACIAAFAVVAWRCRGDLLVYYRGRVVAVLVALFVAVYLIATPWFGLALSHTLSHHITGRSLKPGTPVDAIVVLTAGMINAGPMGWLPKPDSINRLAVAYQLQDMLGSRIPVIVSGGHMAGVQNPSEAAVVAQFFARQRTEITPTELEEASTDTYESAMQLAPVLSKRAAKNVILVTDETHMLRAAATFRGRGIDVIPIPAVSLPVSMGIKMYLPSIYGFGLTNNAMYELYALAGSLLTGKVTWSDLSYNQQKG